MNIPQEYSALLIYQKKFFILNWYINHTYHSLYGHFLLYYTVPQPQYLLPLVAKLIKPNTILGALGRVYDYDILDHTDY